jgi:hypothetical protein
MNKPFIDDEFGPIGRRKSGLPTRAEWLVVALILGAQYSCIRVVVQSAGPVGKAIPEMPPDEGDRVRHPLGFSMVVPPGWIHHTVGWQGVGEIRMFTHTNKRKHSDISITFVGHDAPVQLKGLRRTRFLGQEAYDRMVVLRPWTFDDGAWSQYTLYFRRGGDWYGVTYHMSEERTTVPPMIQRYLNTLRIDERPAGASS